MDPTRISSEHRRLPILPSFSLFFAAAGLLAAGCGDTGKRSGAAPAIRDSAGVTIVEHPAGAVEEAPRWTAGPEPALEIGSLDGDGPRQLAGVTDAALLSDGSVVVGHHQPPELRYFSVDGAHVRTVGREGEGPGEFRHVSALLRLPGDTLLVQDRRLDRLSLFGPEGRFLESFRLGGGRPGDLVGRFGDGTLVTRASGAYARAGPPEEGTRTADVPLVAHGPDGALRDTLVRMPGPTWRVASMGGGGWYVLPVPFTPWPHQAVGPEVLYTGYADAWEIRRRSPAGKVRRFVRLDRERLPVTEAARDSALRTWLERMGEGRARERLEPILRDMELPDRRPAFDAMELDADGRLWVREGGGPTGRVGRRWIVLDGDGTVRAVATLPPGLEVHHLGADRVVGTWTDELDVPHVRVHELRRGAGEDG